MAVLVVEDEADEEVDEVVSVVTAGGEEVDEVSFIVHGVNSHAQLNQNLGGGRGKASLPNDSRQYY